MMRMTKRTKIALGLLALGVVGGGVALGVGLANRSSPEPQGGGGAPGGSGGGGKGGGGGGGGPPPDLFTAAQNAEVALSADPNYCNAVATSGSAVNVAVHNFKVAWNANGKSPALAYNGQYDQDTAAAIESVFGSAPAACFNA